MSSSLGPVHGLRCPSGEAFAESILSRLDHLRCVVFTKRCGPGQCVASSGDMFQRVCQEEHVVP